jgi:hypothetical protein
MCMQAHGITMAVESLYCAHPSAAVTCTLLELESCFAAIDEKVVRVSDYIGVLQARAFCAFFSRSVSFLKDFHRCRRS